MCTFGCFPRLSLSGEPVMDFFFINTTLNLHSWIPGFHGFETVTTDNKIFIYVFYFVHMVCTAFAHVPATFSFWCLVENQQHQLNILLIIITYIPRFIRNYVYFFSPTFSKQPSLHSWPIFSFSTTFFVFVFMYSFPRLRFLLATS